MGKTKTAIGPTGTIAIMMHGRQRLTAFFLLLLLGSAIPGQVSFAASSEWASEAHGAARLISAVEVTGSSAQLDLGLQLRLTPGWHTYWRTPGDAGIAPTIDWNGSENLAHAEIAWPAPRRLPSIGGLETVGYEDGVALPITVTPTHPGTLLHLHADVDYASCKDVCIPYHASLDLVLPPGFAPPGPEAPLIGAARAAVPGNAAAAQLKLLGAVVGPDKGGATLSVRVASVGMPLQSPDLFVEGLANGSPGRPEIALADTGRMATIQIPIRGASPHALANTELRVTMVDGARAAEMVVTPQLGAVPLIPEQTMRLSIIGIALLGGLLLNLMPCVLPVLSLKLLALVGFTGAERRTARLGLIATAVGVVVSFGVLAAVVIVLRAAGAAIGWGIQFQQPWFLAGMALVTTLFAANLWDWLPIALPGRVASRIGRVRGGGQVSDAFLLGAFATLLATSCSAPFVGTAVGFALARGPFDIAFVFGALGVGMAAPFLTVAAAPQLVAWLPRPGPWMGWLRGVLGFALLGTTVWLLAVLGIETGPTAAFIAGAALAVLLAVLAWRRSSSSRRFVAGTAAAALAALAVLVPTLYGEAVPVSGPASTARTDMWRPFDAVALREMVAQGQVVFVDVTAVWCLTCKVNELTVLDRDPVASKLRDPGVVAMRADWTRPDPNITGYLQGVGRYGVPFNAVYGPGAPHGIALPGLLTSDAVMDALRQAAAGPARQWEAIE
jgi:suppressor for copper-sensitivity B